MDRPDRLLSSDYGNEIATMTIWNYATDGGFEAKLPFIVYPRVIDKEKDDSMLDLVVLTPDDRATPFIEIFCGEPSHHAIILSVPN